MADDTNDTVDFRDLLHSPLSDFPDKPSLPAESLFYGKLIGLGAGRSKEKQTPYLRFSVRLEEPSKDIAPSRLAAIEGAGFSLGDYDVYSDFYLTKPSMPMLRGFMDSIGLGGKSFVEALKLSPETCAPTPESQDVVRGVAIVCRTGKANDNGRIFSNLDMIAGRKAS